MGIYETIKNVFYSGRCDGCGKKINNDERYSVGVWKKTDRFLIFRPFKPIMNKTYCKDCIGKEDYINLQVLDIPKEGENNV